MRRSEDAEEEILFFVDTEIDKAKMAYIDAESARLSKKAEELEDDLMAVRQDEIRLMRELATTKESMVRLQSEKQTAVALSKKRRRRGEELPCEKRRKTLKSVIAQLESHGAYESVQRSLLQKARTELANPCYVWCKDLEDE